MAAGGGIFFASGTLNLVFEFCVLQFRGVFPLRLKIFPRVIIALMLLAGGRDAGAESADYLIDLWTSDNDLPDSSVTAITQTHDGYLWIGTHNGLVRFDGVRFVNFDPVNTPELKHARVLGLFTDATGTLWINTYDNSMTSLRNGVFTREWQGSQVSAVFTQSNRIYLTTLAGEVCTRSGNSVPPGDWQTLRVDRRTPATAYRQDAAGVIWCLLRDGRLGRITDTNATLLPDNGGLSGEKINCLTTDPAGRIWVGSEKQIARWDGNQFVNETPTNGEAVVNTTFLFCTASNGLWAFANGSVRHASDRRWVGPDLEIWRDLLQSAGIYVGAYEGENGDVWFRHFGQGLYRADVNGKTERISSLNGLPGNRVSCWFQDREGNVWAGIDRGGLVRLRKKTFQVIGPVEGQRPVAVSTICEDGRSNVWIGTFGGGLNRWRGGKLQRFDLAEGANKSFFFSAFPDAQDRLWLSADREDLFLLETNQITRSTESMHGIKALLVDHLGRVWMGRQNQLTCSSNGVVQHFGANNGFERRDVRALAEDQRGNIWIGTGNGVLYRFANGAFTAFKPDDGLETQAIWALLPEADGTLWVGTFRGGLLRFKDGKFTRYATRDGLPSDIICQILDDGLGKLWFGSHRGIFHVPKDAFAGLDHRQISSLPCTGYGLYDGLPTLECSGNYQPSAWRTQAGILWFATTKGAVAVDPAEVRPNRRLPPVVLEEFLVDGKKFPAAATVEIPPGKHQFDFQFTALSFTAPDKVRFRYRLVGFDNAWVEAGTKRAAHYGPLPPGQYKFQVIASNNDGVWNEQGATLALKQQPFFWQTWWFATLVGVAIIIAVALGVRQAATRSLRRKLENLKQQRAIERERERIAQDIHDDLGAGLTQIMLQSSLARRESPEQMQTDLTQVSETARTLVRTMDEIVWAINPENDSLDGLVTYAGKFFQEFSTAANLRCRLDLPPQPPAIALSAEMRHSLFLAVKETLNNVVKHSRATEVSFSLKLPPGAFLFVIKDNGIGFTPGNANGRAPDHERLSSGHGLRNLARRLEDIGGSFVIISAPGQGTQVELTVPTGNRRQLN
jgi:signal transduction histidine kinase/ligand-binding sensor domain-containing protein